MKRIALFPGTVLLIILFSVTLCYGGSGIKRYEAGKLITPDVLEIPRTMAFSGNPDDLEGIIEEVLQDMGYRIARQGENRIVTEEKDLKFDAKKVKYASRMSQVYCSVTVVVDEKESGRCRVTPQVRLFKTPFQNDQGRESAYLPGWEAEVRRDIFSGISARVSP